MRKLMLGAALWLLALLATAQEVIGQVISISDCDTLPPLKASKLQVKVRLAEIDIPENDQPYGTKSRQALTELASKKRQLCKHVTATGVQSPVCSWMGGTSAGKWSAAGLPGSIATTNKDKSLLTLEVQARSVKRDLWALPEPERMPAVGMAPSCS